MDRRHVRRQSLRLGLLLVLTLGKVEASPAQPPPNWSELRSAMVESEIVAAGVKNPRVVQSMRSTPRHEFVPLPIREKAYYDMALPLGHAQTISPPFIVAYMTEQLDPQPEDRVLEIGTGSGYQAAVLSPLVKEVYTIEIVEPLGRRAARDLKRLKYDNVFAKVGDGYEGWAEHAPFDKIIVTCSPEKVPAKLVEQLKEGGRMIIPVGQRYQQVFYLLRKENGELKQEALRPTLFVPMTGEAERQRKVLPNPKRPTLVNGDFEELEGDPPEPSNWHYQRQLSLSDTPAPPSGKQYALFRNTEAGRAAQALQGFAVDGRVVRVLRVSASVRGREVTAGQTLAQLPVIALIFYDENRATVGEVFLGPWNGTFAWKSVGSRISVPPKAREAIIRIGMFGATGEFGIDAVKIEAAGL